jgi:hypothetical protein
MSYVTVGNVPCHEGSLTVPLVGAWVLEVALSADAMDVADGDPVDATFGDIALHGTIYRGGNFTGRGQLRVVGGFGGWRNTVPKKFYHVALGLRADTIVSDAARECGEKMASAAPGVVGKFWTRFEGPACGTIQLLCPSWWASFDGRTNPSARPGGIMTEPLNVISENVSLSEGVVTCSPALLAGILPGLDFTTPTTPVRTATEVVHRVKAERIRTDIWVR